MTMGESEHHVEGLRLNFVGTTLPLMVSPWLVLPVVGNRPAAGTLQSMVVIDLNENVSERVRASFVAG